MKIRNFIIVGTLLLFLLLCNTAFAATNENTDFSPYMKELQSKIKGNWHPPITSKGAQVKVLFNVDRKGNISETRILSSTDTASNAAALEAVSKSSPFKPLPNTFNGKSINIEFAFDYNVLGNNANTIPVNNYSNRPLAIGTNQFIKDIGPKTYNDTQELKKYKKEISRIILQNLPAEKFPHQVTAKISVEIKSDGKAGAIITETSGRRDYDEMVLKSLQNCVFPKFPDEIKYDNLILQYAISSAHGSNYQFVPIFLPIYPLFYGVR